MGFPCLMAGFDPAIQPFSATSSGWPARGPAMRDGSRCLPPSASAAEAALAGARQIIAGAGVEGAVLVGAIVVPLLAPRLGPADAGIIDGLAGRGARPRHAVVVGGPIGIALVRIVAGSAADRPDAGAGQRHGAGTAAAAGQAADDGAAKSAGQSAAENLAGGVVDARRSLARVSIAIRVDALRIGRLLPQQGQGEQSRRDHTQYVPHTVLPLE